MSKLRDQKFHIIFCDPPYKEKKIESLIENITEMDILEKNGILFCYKWLQERRTSRNY